MKACLQAFFVLMNYHVYIIYSELLDKYYVGYAKELAARLERHLTNHSGYTGLAKDWKIVYSEKCESKTGAILFE